MQIITDTLRAIYNSEKRKDELWQNVLRFHYDTVALKKMAAMMKKIKCLWVGKNDHFFGAKREGFTCISFQSADKAFRENKYYDSFYPIAKLTTRKCRSKSGEAKLCRSIRSCILPLRTGIDKVGACRSGMTR